MFEAKCYDMHGNSIDGFTQWDVNQRIKIVLESCGDDNHIEDDFMRVTPEVHFGNVKRDKALVVRAVEARKDNIVVDVPNILLTEPYPILIYVYYTSSKDSSSQTTIVRTELPVRKRNEPHDYYYVENIERITAEMIKEEIEADTKKTVTKAIEDINDEKDLAVGKINEEESLAIDEINKEESLAVDAINEEERLAIDEINKEERLALQAIANKQASAEAKLQEYVDEGYQIKEDTDQIKLDTDQIKSDTQTIKEETNQIKSDTQDIKNETNKIKSDTQTIKEETASIKEETQSIADTTAKEITTDIYNRIEVVGLQLHTTDDGNGNVTTTIIAPKTE